MVQLKEPPLWIDREIVMARLARKIGRGHDAIYHGTRHLPLVLRSGKLLPANIGKTAVFFTRSPEVAAYWANMIGREIDQFCGGILILNRTSLIQNYRLKPSRYTEEWKYDEREEIIWGRSINIRRHLIGVVRQADVDAILGPPRHRFYPNGWSAEKYNCSGTKKSGSAGRWSAKDKPRCGILLFNSGNGPWLLNSAKLRQRRFWRRLTVTRENCFRRSFPFWLGSN